MSVLKERFIAVGTVRETHTLQKVVSGVLSGQVVLLVDGAPVALEAVSQAWPSRGIEQAETEPGIRGPHHGFGEAILVNIAPLRKIIRHPSLRFERRDIGRLTNTVVFVAHVAGLAPQSLI
ncbi:MAG: spore germination protein [Bacillota bacterium]|nr:spore germination protein [Bacillota bacterium]